MSAFSAPPTVNCLICPFVSGGISLDSIMKFMTKKITNFFQASFNRQKLDKISTNPDLPCLMSLFEVLNQSWFELNKSTKSKKQIHLCVFFGVLFKPLPHNLKLQ